MTEKKAVTTSIITSALTFIVLAYLTNMTPLAAIALPIPAIVACLCANNNKISLPCFAIAAAVICCLLAGPQWLFILIYVVCSTVCCVLAQDRRLSAFYTVAVSVLGAFLGFMLAGTALSLYAGMDISSYLISQIEREISASPAASAPYYILLIAKDAAYGLSADTIENMMSLPISDMAQYVTDNINTLKSMISVLLPSYAATISVVLGVIYQALTRKLAYLFGSNLKQMPAFSDFYIPRKFVPYIVITYFISYIPTMAGIDSLVVPAQILSSLVSITFTLMGMVFFDYLFKFKIKYRVLRVIILAAGLIGVPQVLAWLGIFDVIVDLRHRVNFRRR